VSLVDRLAGIVANRSNSGGCVTCKWYAALPDGDRAAFDDWIADGKSMTQLWEVAVADDDNPFPVSLTALRHHIRNHHTG